MVGEDRNNFSKNEEEQSKVDDNMGKKKINGRQKKNVKCKM